MRTPDSVGGVQGAARPQLGSPVWRIAAATGEEPGDVAAHLGTLGLLGYDADDIWILLCDALNAGLTTGQLVDRLGPKA